MKNRQAILSSIFAAVSDVKVEVKKDAGLTSDKQIKLLQKKLKGLENEDSFISLTDSQLKQLLSSRQADLDNVHELLNLEVGSELSKPFKADQVPMHRYELERRIRETYTFPQDFLEVALSLGRAAIVETEVIDEQLTAKNKAEARTSIEAIRILQGQVIVREGQLIDNYYCRNSWYYDARRVSSYHANGSSAVYFIRWDCQYLST